MPKFQSVFFDLDGTLWDASGCADHALDIVIESRLGACLPREAPEDIKARFNAALLSQLRAGRLSDGMEMLRSGRFQTLLESYDICDSDLVRELTATYNKTLRMITDNYLRDDAPEVLTRLRDAGLSLGILTAGAPALRRQIVAALGIEDMVDHLLIADLEDFGKPDPRLFARMPEAAGVPRKKLLYVGDNPMTDVVGAARAKIPVAWLRTRDQKLPDGVPEPGWTIEQLRGVLGIVGV